MEKKISIFRLLEDDGDILTLLNTIYNRDMRNQGYAWADQSGKSFDIRSIFKLMPQNTFKGGAKYVTEEVNQIVPETNDRDPRITSTDPEYINCAAFYGQKDQVSVCRVTGRPCLFTNADYLSCGIRHNALTGNPEYWQMPYGREQDIAYVHGLKD